MIIRSATDNDLDCVYHFICELEGKTFDFPAFSNLYHHNIRHQEYFYWIAEDQSTAVGFISLHVQTLLHHNGKTGEIQELFVAETYRTRGIGQMLVDTVETKATELGLLEVEVTPHMNRTLAHRFYQKMNFNQTHLKFTKANIL